MKTTRLEASRRCLVPFSCCAIAMVAVTIVAAPARAFDISSCDAIVPAGATGTLQADLSCAATGVSLEKNAKLELNGHMITSTGTCVEASAGGTVHGPGELSGCGTGILSSGRRTIRISTVGIHDGVGDGLEFQGVGIWALQARVEATNVAVNDNGNSGMMVHVLKATHVTASGNKHYGITEDRGTGEDVTLDGNGTVGLVYGTRGSFTGLVATNNGSPNFASGGLSGNRVVLRDSTVTGNAHFDISGFKKPILIGTTCGTSIGGPNPNGSWGVCTSD
jgi:hypothetical protein